MRSNEENFFKLYLDELKDAGFIAEYSYEPKSFVLSEKVIREKEGKWKTIFQEHVYTPDFYIKFNKIPTFLKSSIVNNEWWVDVKGAFNLHGGDRIFPINAKWMYQVHGIIVEKIVPQKLFEKTFTPELYLVTDKTKKLRKIKWQIIKLKQLLNSQE